MTRWYEKYLGARFEFHPDPPRSFSCGELVFWVLKEELGIVTPYKFANRELILTYVRDMMGIQKYGFDLLAEGEVPQEFDLLGMGTVRRYDHMGIAAETPEGLKVLHSYEKGVQLSTIDELRGYGFNIFDWFRHKEAR